MSDQKARIEKQQEMVRIFALLTAAYPRFDTFQSKEKLKPVIQLWAELLFDVEYKVLEMAIKKLILESPFPPVLADVRKRVSEITSPPEDIQVDGGTAWAEVTKAIRLYGYYRGEEALASMSRRTADVVKSIGWQEICTCEESGVVRGQFLKMYERIADREKQQSLLPEHLKQQIKRIGEGGLKLIDCSNM